jgi:chemotaxis response regulator CheB
MMARRRLKKLKILEVSAVDVAANPHARIMLMKRAGKEDLMDTILAVAKRVVAGDATPGPASPVPSCEQAAEDQQRGTTAGAGQ